MSIFVVDPVQDAVATTSSKCAMAPRLATLDGKTLGLYANIKLNSAELLEQIGAELKKRFSFNVMRGVYNAAAIMPKEQWGEIDKCDAVILANGDCGACSSSGIGNAIELEKRGIPTLLVSTPPFFQAVKTIAEMRRMPQIKWAVVDHPIACLGEEELRQRAVAAAEQFCALVLQPVARSAARKTA